jgi:hypothetical protein
MMALKRKTVLLADFDPQFNLTGMVMGFKGVDDLTAIYSGAPPNNVKGGLAPAFESQTARNRTVKCVTVPGTSAPGFRITSLRDWALPGPSSDSKSAFRFHSDSNSVSQRKRLQ